MNLAIIIPAYNEEKTISEVIKRTDALDLDKKIIVVDDGSKDKTWPLVKENFKNVILLRHKINLGKGAALKTGCEAAMKIGTGIIVFIDADCQHPPEIIPRLIKKIEKENLDIVFGGRKMNEEMPFLFYAGNKFLTKIINLMSGVRLTDTQGGLKAFKSEIYPKISWQASDYYVETEIIFNTGKHNLKYGQIIIETTYKDAYKGTTIFDGFKIFLKILKQKLV